MSNIVKPKGRVLFAYLLLPLTIYIFAVFIPLITAGYYSFFEWKGGPTKLFTGFQNYMDLLKDQVFWSSFKHNIFLVLVCVIGQIGLAFLIVLIINSRLVKLKGIHRTFSFFPSTISAVYIGFIWMMIYDYNKGLINWFLKYIGNTDAAKVWLSEKSIIMLIVSIPLIWQYIGYYMVIIMAAISSIDNEIFEVSELDGANAFQRAIYIILPLIKNTLLICVTLCVAGNMKVFDHIYVMTNGGPGNASNVMALYSYQTSFTRSNMGYGSAIAIAIFILSLLVIGGVQFFIRQLTKEKAEV